MVLLCITFTAENRRILVHQVWSHRWTLSQLHWMHCLWFTTLSQYHVYWRCTSVWICIYTPGLCADICVCMGISV